MPHADSAWSQASALAMVDDWTQDCVASARSGVPESEVIANDVFGWSLQRVAALACKGCSSSLVAWQLLHSMPSTSTSTSTWYSDVRAILHAAFQNCTTDDGCYDRKYTRVTFEARRGVTIVHWGTLSALCMYRSAWSPGPELIRSSSCKFNLIQWRIDTVRFCFQAEKFLASFRGGVYSVVLALLTLF